MFASHRERPEMSASEVERLVRCAHEARNAALRDAILSLAAGIARIFSQIGRRRPLRSAH